MSAPEVTFTVVGARAVEHAAAPTLAFDFHASEPEGREVYTIALTAQINVDPAKRSHDPATRERLMELFGEPERWAATTQSFLWQRVDVLVPSFAGETGFELPALCTYDQEIAATKYFSSLPDGEVPLTFHLSGTIFYRGEDDRLQLVKVPWSSSVPFRLAIDVWNELVDHYYPQSGWIGVQRDTLELLGRYKAERGLPTFDACLNELLAERSR